MIILEEPILATFLISATDPLLEQRKLNVSWQRSRNPNLIPCVCPYIRHISHDPRRHSCRCLGEISKSVWKISSDIFRISLAGNFLGKIKNKSISSKLPYCLSLKPYEALPYTRIVNGAWIQEALTLICSVKWIIYWKRSTGDSKRKRCCMLPPVLRICLQGNIIRSKSYVNDIDPQQTFYRTR